MAKWINLMGICGGIFAFVHFILGGMTGNSPAPTNAINTQQVQQAVTSTPKTAGLRDPRELVQQREKSRAERTIENYERTARMIDDFDQNSGFWEEFQEKRAHHAEALRNMRGY